MFSIVKSNGAVSFGPSLLLGPFVNLIRGEPSMNSKRGSHGAQVDRRGCRQVGHHVAIAVVVDHTERNTFGRVGPLELTRGDVEANAR